MATLSEDKPEASPVLMNGYDRIFLLFLFLVFCVVTWLGVHSRQEALKTEAAKGNGEAWVTWFKEANQKRFEANYAIAACAGGGQADAPRPDSPPGAAAATSDSRGAEAAKAGNGGPQAGTWAACLAAMLQDAKIKDMINPFTGEAPKLIEACVPTDLSLAGAIDIDKSIATPPGSAIPFVKSNLAPTDSIREKLLLTVIVCDRGGYPIKIAEFEF